MLQQDKPDDYVVATGQTHTVKEFAQFAFDYVDLDWQDYVVVDKNFYRPSEIHELRGDYSKAERVLGWTPQVKFNELVQMMVKGDTERIKHLKNTNVELIQSHHGLP